MLANDRERLRVLIQERYVLSNQELLLSSGKKSSYYFDIKAAVLDFDCASLIAEAFLAEIDQLPIVPNAIGGLAMGANCIVASVIVRAHQFDYPTTNGSIVCKFPHGSYKIENQLASGTQIVVVDDVLTTGGSIREACEVFQAHEHKIVGIIALVDRMAGGREELERDYGIVRTVFTKDDFLSEIIH